MSHNAPTKCCRSSSRDVTVCRRGALSSRFASCVASSSTFRFFVVCYCVLPYVSIIMRGCTASSSCDDIVYRLLALSRVASSFHVDVALLREFLRVVVVVVCRHSSCIVVVKCQNSPLFSRVNFA